MSVVGLISIGSKSQLILMQKEGRCIVKLGDYKENIFGLKICQALTGIWFMIGIYRYSTGLQLDPNSLI